MTIGDKNKKLTTKVTATLLSVPWRLRACARCRQYGVSKLGSHHSQHPDHINPPTQQALAPWNAAFEAK